MAKMDRPARWGLVLIQALPFQLPILPSQSGKFGLNAFSPKAKVRCNQLASTVTFFRFFTESVSGKTFLEQQVARQDSFTSKFFDSMREGCDYSSNNIIFAARLTAEIGCARHSAHSLCHVDICSVPVQGRATRRCGLCLSA
jgi:hypothetical protein